jgi:hypothetical protein
MNANSAGSRAGVFPSLPAEQPGSTALLTLRNQAEAFQALLAEVQVSVSGYFYAVDFGPGVRPQHHRIGHNGICSCYLGDLCPAVDVVRVYLADGGEPVPEPPPGYYPVIPLKCPICGSPVTFDSKLSSRQRGAGWRCTAGGSAHYWERMGQALAQKFAARNAAQTSTYPE